MKMKLPQWLRMLKRGWKSVDAQDLVEYALLLLLVALAVGATVKSFGNRVSSTFLGAAMSVAEMNFRNNATNTAVVGAGLSNTAAVDNQAATVNGNAAVTNAFNAFISAFTSAAAAQDYSAAANAAANAAGFDARAAAAAAAGNFAAAAADTASANQDAAIAAQAVADAQGKVTTSLAALNSGLLNTGIL